MFLSLQHFVMMVKNLIAITVLIPSVGNVRNAKYCIVTTVEDLTTECARSAKTANNGGHVYFLFSYHYLQEIIFVLLTKLFKFTH